MHTTQDDKKIYIRKVLTVWSLMLAIIASLFLYVFYVNAAVFHVAERTDIESQVAELRSVISETELEIISHARTITDRRLSDYDLTYVSVDELAFIETNDKTRLTLQTQ